MSLWSMIGPTLRHLRQSVDAQYGGGIVGFFQFVYFSLLRLNTFVVFVHDCRETCQPITMARELHIKRQCWDALLDLRRPSPMSREFYGDRIFGCGDFFMAYWGDEPAYIHWVLSVGKQSRFLRLGEHCAEITYMLTLPPFRGKRICSQVVDYTVHKLMEEGVEKIYCVIHDQNVASIKAVRRAGFRELRNVKSLGPFNFRVEASAS